MIAIFIQLDVKREGVPDEVIHVSSTGEMDEAIGHLVDGYGCTETWRIRSSVHLRSPGECCRLLCLSSLDVRVLDPVVLRQVAAELFARMAAKHEASARPQTSRASRRGKALGPGRPGALPEG